jgi:putative tryptophan/tyrosine transport system substrate-binding protein
MQLRAEFGTALGLVIGLMGFLGVPEAVAAPRVMIVHSYEKGHVCGQPQHDGIVAALKKQGFAVPGDVEIDTYFMDTKRRNNTPDLILDQADRVMERIEQNPPDVLVTLDDNAFRTVGLEMADSRIPVVFCGMNGQPEDYHRQRPFLNARSRPGHNITGVYEKLHIVDAFRVHARLFPNVGRIRILLDTSPTGRAIGRQVDLELGEDSSPVSWDVRTVTDWNAYQQEILQANRDTEIGALYLATLLLKSDSGKTYTAPEIFQWTVKTSTKPEIAVNYAFTRLGLFGGAAVDFHAMGEQAGGMVARILQGEDAGGIPIEEAKKYALVFNIQRARQLGISIPSDILMAADEVVDSTP